MAKEWGGDRESSVQRLTVVFTPAGSGSNIGRASARQPSAKMSSGAAVKTAGLRLMLRLTYRDVVAKDVDRLRVKTLRSLKQGAKLADVLDCFQREDFVDQRRARRNTKDRIHQIARLGDHFLARHRIIGCSAHGFHALR